MILRWTELNENVELVAKDSYPINTGNVHQYAKDTCRKCHGRGWERFSGGKDYNILQVKAGLSERFYSCTCVDKHLSKLESLKEPVKAHCVVTFRKGKKDEKVIKEFKNIREEG